MRLHGRVAPASDRAIAHIKIKFVVAVFGLITPASQAVVNPPSK